MTDTKNSAPATSTDSNSLSHVAAIDLGSNSFHMVIAQSAHGELKPIERLGEKVQLAAGLNEEGFITAAAIERGLSCLKRFAQRLEGFSSEQVNVVGTNALRKAKNAEQFIQQAEVVLGHKIEVIFGKAIETIETLDMELDFTFIDADKRNYLNYYRKALEMTRPGGLIVLDNMLWSGKVIQPESDIDDVLVELNKEIAADPNVENIFLTVRDGMNVVRKIR